MELLLTDMKNHFQKQIYSYCNIGLIEFSYIHM